MEEQKARLGRGLDALLPNANETQKANGNQISTQTIDANPNQPRKQFDEDDLDSLASSIRNHGVLQPLVVRKVGERYQLIAGERRLRAVQKLGMEQVPVTVVNFNDQQVFEAALVENMQRADLNPIEKANGFKDYLARFKMTHDQLAKRLGVARSSITNLVSLLDLSAEVQEMIRVGQLSTGHAKVLKSVKEHTDQTTFAREAIARGLSVHALDNLIKEPIPEEATAPSSPSPENEEPEKTAHVVGIEEELRQKFATKVEIKVQGKDRGKIILSFDNNEDFERLLNVFRG